MLLPCCPQADALLLLLLLPPLLPLPPPPPPVSSQSPLFGMACTLTCSVLPSIACTLTTRLITGTHSGHARASPLQNFDPCEDQCGACPDGDCMCLDGACECQVSLSVNRYARSHAC
jgi:hypothetical protein